MADNGTSATDIITYIGVPLAVLGVLPILYNTFATLGSLARIRRMLRYNHLNAVTRGDVVNRVIEIELPRFAIMPVDRLQEPEAYWTLSRAPSLLPGGSWTAFNWRTNMIGMRVQRVEYADQVRQPQAEVALNALVSYLLDLGAVPNQHGWRVLRTAGLWAPVGCTLMTSPDGRAKVLTVAPLNDSDGHLSLAVSWSGTWATRDDSSLPPHWVNLPCPPSLVNEVTSRPSSIGKMPGKVPEVMDDHEEETGKGKAGSKDARAWPTTDDPTDGGYTDSITRQGQLNGKSDIICQIRESGLVNALVPKANESPDMSYREGLYIDHLLISGASNAGTWFASAATAYNTSNRNVLWEYKIPDDILRFAQRDSIPCGVLEMLGIVSDSDTPQWATVYDDIAEKHDRFTRKHQQRFEIMMKEKNLSPEEKSRAARERMDKERRDFLQEVRDEHARSQQRAEKRKFEALQSPKWDTEVAAHHCLEWLKARNTQAPESESREAGEGSKNGVGQEQEGPWHSKVTIKEAVGYMLRQMVLNGEFASTVSQVLDAWRAWSELGGMRQGDYEAMYEKREVFAQAVLLMALVKQCGQEAEGSLAADLQECFRVWKIVRLG